MTCPACGRENDTAARFCAERSKAICRELGIAYGLAEAHTAGAELEVLARDLPAAERELRDAIRVADEMDADHYVALYRLQLAPRRGRPRAGDRPQRRKRGTLSRRSSVESGSRACAREARRR